MAKNVFISYRSTPYTQLVAQGCKVVNNNEKCNCDIALKCSVQNCEFKRASIFARKQTYNCFLVPPIYMLPPNTILTPIDFYQNLPLLQSLISKSDIFVRFEISEDSFWTNLEFDFWRKRSIDLQDNICYNVWLDEDEETQSEALSFPSMSKNKAYLYWRLLHYTSNEHKFDHEWGRYSNCFICTCPNCGRISLYSLNALNYLIKKDLTIRCTHCHEASFSFNIKSKWRNLITFDYQGNHNPTTPLSNDFIMNLLLNSKKEVLDQIHLICMSHETFPKMIAMTAAPQLIKDIIKKHITGTHIELRTYKNGEIIKVPLS